MSKERLKELLAFVSDQFAADPEASELATELNRLFGEMRRDLSSRRTRIEELEKELGVAKSRLTSVEQLFEQRKAAYETAVRGTEAMSKMADELKKNAETMNDDVRRMYVEVIRSLAALSSLLLTLQEAAAVEKDPKVLAAVVQALLPIIAGRCYTLEFSNKNAFIQRLSYVKNILDAVIEYGKHDPVCDKVLRRIRDTAESDSKLKGKALIDAQRIWAPKKAMEGVVALYKLEYPALWRIGERMAGKELESLFSKVDHDELGVNENECASSPDPSAASVGRENEG